MNMKPQYRAELKQLARAEKKIIKDWQAHDRSVDKQITALNRSLDRSHQNCTRELARINKRRAILQGRLNS